MAVARQIQIHAEEDGVVAVQTDTIVDPERGLVAEVEKVMVAVDAGEGKVAVMEQERLKAIRAIPTQAQPSPAATTYKPASNPQPHPPPRRPPVTRSSYKPAPNPSRPRKLRRVPITNDRTPLVQTTKTHRSHMELPGCLFCGSVFLTAGAALIGLAVALVLPCGPLLHASIPIIVFGCLTIFVGCICCAFTARIKGPVAVICFFCVGILLGLMLTAAAFESPFVFGDYSLKKNGTYIDGCKFDQYNATPVALTVLSYVLLVLTCCFCLGAGINAATRNDPWLYKDRRASLC